MADERDRADRDRRDILRRYEYVREQRGYPNLRDNVPREDALARLQQANTSTESGLIEQVFKFGLVVAGAVAFHKFMFRTRSGLELLGKVGSLGKQFSHHFKRFVTYAAEESGHWSGKSPDELLNIARVRQGIQRPSAVFEQGRIRDIDDALSIIRASGDASVQQNILRGESGTHVRRLLKGRGKRDGGVFGWLGRWADTRKSDLVSGLDHIRMEDVLKTNQSIVGSRSANIVRQGIELGLVHKKTILAKGAMINRGSGQVIDASWATGKNLWGGFQAAMDQIRIPIVGFRLGQFFRAPAHFVGRSLYGQGGITSIRMGTRIPGVAKLNMGGFAVGDAVFGYGEGRSVVKIGTGFRWFDPKVEKSIARVAGANLGHYTEPRAFDDTDTWWKKIQKAIGIGPQYSTERSFFSKFVADPWRRVTRGEPGLKEKISSDTQPFTKRLIEQVEGLERRKIANTARKVGFWDKLRAAFGKGKHTEYTSRGRGAGQVAGIRRPDAGGGFLGEDIAIYHKSRSTGIFTNYLATRPSEMASWLTGIGFRPGMGRFGAVKSVAKTAALYHGATMGIEAVKYADYALEDTIGVSPIKLGAGAYTRIRLGQKWIQDQIGITKAARWMEDRFPKSINSPASGLLRAALPILGGAARGKKGAIAGLIGSVALGGLPHSIFMPEDLLKSREELDQEYKGLRRVPVRQNRWWELNSEEYTGGKIKFFKKSWYAQLKSGYEYTDVKYGSKSNYWKYQSDLPTPSNWLGLRKIFNPNWLADAQAVRRPYPHSGGAIGGFGARQTAAPDVTGGGLGGGQVASPTSFGQRFSGAWESVTEHLGAYKFLGETMLGVESPFEADMELASASEMSSIHRKYWDQDLGGLMGATELVRRYILPRNAMAKSYNPLPNVAPDWLPGIRAQFDEDSRYFLDFHRGDPYTKVQQGETRVPGPGYEAIQRLHSGVPGVYDAYDRYKILADIAPYSKGFRHYKTIVRSWLKAGVLDKTWAEDFEQTEQEFAAVREGGQFVDRKFTSHQEGISAINQELKYGPVESTMGAIWETFTHDIVPTIPFGRKMLKTESPYESYLENEIYGETYKDWRRPMKGFIAPHFNRASSKGPFMGAALGATIGIMGGSPVSKITFAALGAVIGGVGGTIHGKGWVPTERRTEFAAMEYFDKLKYVRAKRLQGIAIQEGDFSTARQYKAEAERTIVGLPKDASIGQMQAAMPKTLKPYFRKLLQIAPADRMNVMKTVPSYVRPAFEQMWGMGTMNNVAPAEQVTNYFSKNKLPDSSWMGWQPQVPFDMSKLKFIKNNALDAHHLHEWEDESLVNPAVYANMETPSGFLGDQTDPTELENLRRQLASVHILDGSVHEAPRSLFELHRKDTSLFDQALARFR